MPKFLLPLCLISSLMTACVSGGLTGSDWCQTHAPLRYSAATIKTLDRAQKEAADANNKTGVRLCRWKA